jgi:1,2-phenylacetyl-CoA epoxidase catalytic subunit
MTSSAADRLNLARARLELLGAPQPDEPLDVTAKREQYREMLDEATAELSEVDRRRYGENDD